MPKYKFRWDAFDDTTVVALATAIGFDSERCDMDARTWLGTKKKRPDDNFIRETFQTLLTTPWLRDYHSLGEVVGVLIERNIGPQSNPRSQSGYLAYLRKCRNSKTLRTLLCQAIISYGEDGHESTGPRSWIKSSVMLVPEKQSVDEREPHAYQMRAWEALGAKWAGSQRSREFRGLLVMPTGSGKTFTAVRWLIESVLNHGGKILWVAHRQELLEQAAAAFDRAIFLAEPKTKRFRRRIVSGQHCSSSQIGPGDDILICSVASLARRPDIVERLLSDHFLVIDEAHHAPAKSYRDLIRRITMRGNKLVLGLTATPTRTVESERPELARLFGSEPVYEVRVRELIETGFLANPVPVRVQTKSDVEEGLTDRDIVHLQRFRDLSEDWLDRIAHFAVRNSLIVNHYLEHRKKYGKTLIFAINVHHAHLLRDSFCQVGVHAECVTSYSHFSEESPELEPRTRQEVIEAFQEPNSGLDVLVNVMILTEGFDVPRLQTVFLTRPTQSEILLRQMVGRALRGPKAGGTTQAYLVSFDDHWEKFRELESPFGRLTDLLPPEEIVAPADREVLPKAVLESDSLPYPLISAVAAEIRRIGRSQPMDVFESVPHGWYILEQPTSEIAEDQDAKRDLIHVYEHQKPCWDALILHLEGNTDWSAEALAFFHAEYFGDCDIPLPSTYDFTRMSNHLQSGGETPIYTEYSERRKSDPAEIAKRVQLENADKFSLTEECYHKPLVKAIYPTHREYVSAVDQALYDLQYPDTVMTRYKPGTPVFEPRPDQLLTPPVDGEFAHDLDALMREVLEEAKAVLNVDPPYSGKIVWTRRLIKGWFGQARWERETEAGGGLIKINCLLNSPDISAETMKFLLWHEYLHLYLQALHTKTFRELEAKWPTRIESDRELDNLSERFEISYW